MLRLFTLLIFTIIFFVTSVFSQEVKGDWYGQLETQGIKLRINFHVNENDGIYTTTMDSPDQGAMGIPTTKTTVGENTLEVSLVNMGINYKGELKDGIITGIFKQGGGEIPLVLTRNEIVASKPKIRPQDPIKPYGYKSEEVVFTNPNANNIKLSGTLTLPKGIKNPPVAILISGSGPQNRDEELLNHRPFLVLSDYLTNNGIAVLRYDDRGVAKSEGSQEGATSADFATDVEAAVKYLESRNDIDSKKIGLIGHSEGGLIAPIVASQNKNIAFIVLLAGTGVAGAEVLRTQTNKSLELSGMGKDFIDYNDKMSRDIFDLVRNTNDLEVLKEQVTKYIEKAKLGAPKDLAAIFTDEHIKNQVKTLTSPWMNYFIKTDPDVFLSKVKCPVLAINGEKDFQVLPKLNLEGIEKSLKKAKNKDVTIKELEGLNHLFQTCTTGAFAEYSQIEETFSPLALKIVGEWINSRF